MSPKLPSLSIVLPCLDEAENQDTLLQALIAACVYV